MAHAWIAFLRAVNLGPTNKVPMAELRALLEREGYGAVRTYIASGNVLLAGPPDRDAVARDLEQLVAGAFGVETVAILRTPSELASVAATHPFGDDTSRTHVSFLAAVPGSDATGRLAESVAGDERAFVEGAHVYLRYPDGVHRSRLTPARLERLLGVAGTARNWRTVTALAELAASARSSP